MIKKFFKPLLFLTFLLAVIFTTVAAQEHPPFWGEIQHFKQQDSAAFPPKHAILFVGSSSIRFWTDVQDYFPGYTIINRGFGGSCLPDMIRYAGDIIFPYQPKEIVIYCGENDFAASDTVTPEMVFKRFRHLFTMIRQQLPGVPVVFISMKPSPSRERLMPKMLQGNRMIKAYLKKKKKAYFVDVYHAMLTEQGKPMPDIFRDDQLHMKPKGYAIWQKKIAPYLIK